MATNIVNSNHMRRILYTNTGSAISAGDIVKVGTTGQAFLAVALEDIAATTGTGQVGVCCDVTVAKVSAAVWKQGEFVIWDSSASAFDDNQATPASGDVSTNAAIAVADGANAETSAVVFLTGISGTLTA